MDHFLKVFMNSLQHCFCFMFCFVFFGHGPGRIIVHQSIQSLNHGLRQARLPCPSPTPGACSNSCPLSQWCHPITSSSVVPFFSPARDQTHMPCTGRQSLNHWTTREALLLCFQYGSSYVHFKPPEASPYSLYPAPWLLGFPGGSVVNVLGLKSATLWQ